MNSHPFPYLTYSNRNILIASNVTPYIHYSMTRIKINQFTTTSAWQSRWQKLFPYFSSIRSSKAQAAVSAIVLVVWVQWIGSASFVGHKKKEEGLSSSIADDTKLRNGKEISLALRLLYMFQKSNLISKQQQNITLQRVEWKLGKKRNKCNVHKIVQNINLFFSRVSTWRWQKYRRANCGIDNNYESLRDENLIATNAEKAPGNET